MLSMLCLHFPFPALGLKLIEVLSSLFTKWRRSLQVFPIDPLAHRSCNSLCNQSHHISLTFSNHDQLPTYNKKYLPIPLWQQLLEFIFVQSRRTPAKDFILSSSSQHSLHTLWVFAVCFLTICSYCKILGWASCYMPHLLQWLLACTSGLSAA